MAIAQPLCNRDTFDNWLEKATDHELQKGHIMYVSAADRLDALLQQKKARREDITDTARMVTRMQARSGAISDQIANRYF